MYFTDHGAPGLVGFPNNPLYAIDLKQTLSLLHDQDRYKRMLIYVEACESGSMFDNGLLPSDWRILATTAANPHESSYAIYWSDQYGAYLGDEYSVAWMEDSDNYPTLQERTIQDQFDAIEKKVMSSHPQVYGDMTLSKVPLSEFQGMNTGLTQESVPSYGSYEVPASCHDVPLMTLDRKIRLAKENVTRAQLEKKRRELVEGRRFVSLTSLRIAVRLARILGASPSELVFLTGPSSISNWECYKRLVDSFHAHCFNLGQHPFALSQLGLLVNFCEFRRYPPSASQVRSAAQAIQLHCRHYVTGRRPFNSIQ